MEFRVWYTKQSEKCNFDSNLVWFNKIQKRFLCAHAPAWRDNSTVCARLISAFQKNTTLGRTAVRETGVSRHHWIPIEGSQKPFVHHRHSTMVVKGLREAPNGVPRMIMHYVWNVLWRPCLHGQLVLITPNNVYYEYIIIYYYSYNVYYEAYVSSVQT